MFFVFYFQWEVILHVREFYFKANCFDKRCLISEFIVWFYSQSLNIKLCTHGHANKHNTILFNFQYSQSGGIYLLTLENLRSGQHAYMNSKRSTVVPVMCHSPLGLKSSNMTVGEELLMFNWKTLVAVKCFLNYIWNNYLFSIIQSQQKSIHLNTSFYFCLISIMHDEESILTSFSDKSF